MAITLTSGNLNIWGDSGQFETDPSTWGFSSALIPSTRSSESTSGNYGCKSEKTTPLALAGKRRLCAAKFSGGGKLIAKAFVKSPSANLIGLAASQIYIQDSSDSLTVLEAVNKTVTEIEGNTFVEISLKFETALAFKSKEIGIYINDNIQDNGIIYIDQFEIYEYEETPEPDCDIKIDLANSTVVNASGAGLTDGSIAVATTGTPLSALEYSKDGGATWQASNQFTGLGYGIYEVVIRESGRITCSDTSGFAINEGAPGYDFTPVANDASTLGSDDGSIEITLSGNFTNPVEFSSDGGLTYQSANILENLITDQYLVVTKDANGFLLAKVVTVSSNSAVFDDIFFSENMIPYERSATNNSTEENYKIMLQISTSAMSLLSNSFALKFSEKMRQSLKPNIFGKSVFNLRPAFRNLFKAVPPARNETFQLVRDRTIVSQKGYGDVFNDMTEPVKFLKGPVDLIVYGGLNKEKYPNVNFFKGYLPQEKKFMTWRPRISYVDRTQEDYLTYFSAISATTQLKVRVKAYFDDGTNETATIHQTEVSAELYGKMYQIPAGPVTSGASGINPLKNLTQYDLWIENQDNQVITEVMNFRLTTFKPSLTRYILFLNSVGGYDVVRLTGKTAQSSEIEKQKVNKYLDFDYLSSDGEEKNTHSKSNQTFEYSSGMFKGKYAEYMAEYMQDLLHSKKAYDITNGERIPINIAGGTFRIKETADFKYFTRFEAKLAYTDSLFTPSALPKLSE